MRGAALDHAAKLAIVVSGREQSMFATGLRDTAMITGAFALLTSAAPLGSAAG
jgi:hypothetical protein